MKLSKHIFNLLHENSCVVIPNFGALITRNISAKISPDGTKISPPNKEISFNKSLVKNDGLLITEISIIENMSYQAAEIIVEKWVNKIEKRIRKKGYVSFKNIGIIELKNDKYIFSSYEKTIFQQTSYGLNLIHSSKLKRSNFDKNNSYLKYAAVLIIFLSIGGFFTKSYFNNIVEYNENSYAQANFEVEKKIQNATFSINNSFPAVMLPIKKQYGNFHIIAGSFRLEENSLKMISKLKSKGFLEARKVGLNKYGLIQVAYNSYKSIREARLALSEIRLDQDSNAWLLIKN